MQIPWHTDFHTNATADPSGLGTYSIRTLLFFKFSSNSFIALAGVGHHIASTSVNPKGLSVLVACRFIPLDKCPAVKPIRLGEVPIRVIAKTTLKIIGGDAEEAADPFQLHEGQSGGCEAAVHDL